MRNWTRADACKMFFIIRGQFSHRFWDTIPDWLREHRPESSMNEPKTTLDSLDAAFTSFMDAHDKLVESILNEYKVNRT